MNADAAQPYHLSLTSAATTDLRRLFNKAKTLGIAADVLAVARRIDERLRCDPLEAGEPLYHLGPPAIAIRILPMRPLAAEYGVMEEHRAVCIRSFRGMLDLGP